jgi:hypothetical protein
MLTSSLLFLSLITVRYTARFRLIFRRLARSVPAAKLHQFVLECVFDRTLIATTFAGLEMAHAPYSRVRRSLFMPGPVLDAFQTRRMFSVVAESMRWNENTRSERSVRSSGEFSDRRRQDKRASPSERQAIDMAWVRPCRSVGARAALQVLASQFNDVFGTMLGSLGERRVA